MRQHHSIGCASCQTRIYSEEQTEYIPAMTRSGGLSGSSCWMEPVNIRANDCAHVLSRLTTIRSYTSTALCVAVATGYSCISSKEVTGRSSLNTDGTISGAKPCVECAVVIRGDQDAFGEHARMCEVSLVYEDCWMRE